MTLTYENPGRSANHVNADWLFANGFVAAVFLYTLLFNLIVDDGLRTSIAGGLGIIAVARCLFSWYRPSAQAATLLFLGLAFLVAFYFIFLSDPLLIAGSPSELSLRMLTGYAIFLLFAFAPRMVSPTLLISSCVVIVIVATLVAATGQPVFYAGTVRPAVFTGGEDAVHSTALTLTAAFLGILTLWRMGRLATVGVVILSVPLLILILLLQVRTCWMMILCYMAAVAVLRKWKGDRSNYWITVPIVLGIAGISIWLSSQVANQMDFSAFSSGRTDAYSERLDMLASRPPINLLFGTGVGSEMMRSSVWWWEDKVSHNDFIDITIQTGIVGLALTAAMLCLAAAQLDRYQLPLYLSFLISSAVSAGLMFRPFIAALLLSFMAVPAMGKRARETGK
jgi:O-antigen ligase